MAALVLLRNPLSPHTREIVQVDPGTPVIDWLQQDYPHGFGAPIRFWVNGEEKPLDDLDYPVQKGDVAVIALMPAEPVSLSAIAVSLAISLALSAITFAVQYFFFQPKEKSGIKGERRSVYDISSDQNAARIGDAIPVVYGEVMTTLDYVAQPYTWYSWNLSSNGEPLNGIQYLDVVLCVGQGNIDVSDVFVGDTDVSNIEGEGAGGRAVTWRAFKPAQHNSTMGTIAAAMGSGFFENVITSTEVSNQELPEAGSTAGYFAAGKPGSKGNKFQLDFVCPNGFFFVNAGDGDIQPLSRSLRVSWVELNDNDDQVGTVYTQTISISTNAPNTTNRAVLASPVRRTYTITAVKSARWAVKVERIDGAPTPQKGQSMIVWAALKLLADYPATPVYGNVTLLAARIKASRGVGQEGAVRLRARVTRRLARPAGGAEAQSTNPADAFADVCLDTVYGAARPRGELDTATLTTLRSTWSAYKFNHVFRERITVWEALRTILTPFAAEPLPIGAVMSVAQDGVKAVRSALFTDANIIAGSMGVTYSFDEEGAADGVEIEYLDPKDWRQSYTTYPTNALRPERFTLPGVTSASHAAEYARLTWQRVQGQRKRITFGTELEGLFLQLGDRIGVAHNVPKWGDGGLVIGVNGLTLTVDHDLDWSGGVKQILLRKPDGGVTDPITVSRGATDHHVVLPSTSPTTINTDNEYEYTSFAFGSATTLVRDFIVVAVKPAEENRVTIEAVNYAPTIFTGAMSFLT
jgi:hypothetical protein